MLPQVQRAPDRLVGLHAVIELLEVALQSRELLRDVRTVREEDDLLQQPLVVDFQLLQPRTLDALNELVTVTLLHLRRLFADASHRLAHRGHALAQILLEVRPLLAAHLHQHRQGKLQRLVHGRPERLGIAYFVIGFKHARCADQMIERQVVLDLQLLRQLPQLARVGLGERGVDADARGFLALAGVQGDAGGHAAPGNLAVHLIADLRLQDFEFTGKVDGDLALLAVDRAEFDRDFETVLGTFTPTIASHRFHAQRRFTRSRAGEAMQFLKLETQENPRDVPIQ